ncbi:RecQ family ATP-dependent DNA helicase [Sutterella sp.]|uniref:RecQ family ATP-dependent DNA helicase n=1 Tax=Sutterella sp. TaxID=1981025 RepID=UPI0026E086C3|nr:RecQ family ATP-dependent DNA helicase [Sutterella sp.]MDO5531606.1 RecQ family ATP-dependent DNA helicase [Sutterella sp.]
MSGGRVVFIDIEVGVEDRRIHDYGAVREDGACLHTPVLRDFRAFLEGADFVCGHNIIRHDLKRIEDSSGSPLGIPAIDTLFLSPLLFPRRPYHALVKDDKLLVDQLNNPVNDSEKARELFHDEVNAFHELPGAMQRIFMGLLAGREEFRGFFDFIGFHGPEPGLARLIRETFAGKICENAALEVMIETLPTELAYVLALIGSGDEDAVTPAWVTKTFPFVGHVMRRLRGTPCAQRCEYCRGMLDIHAALKRFFGYDGFRTWNGEPLQERATQAAVDGSSLLAIFPTGGGKSLTFQVPALLFGRAVHGLTVVISPLQSLMNDQVDNLRAKGIADAVTVNGMLSPVDHAEALERIENGSANLLYISPESLRSRTMERLLLGRTISRFVIDEAHCFSAWGQDFRVDYLYIADFIAELQRKKGDGHAIPVSCFTATAKQKVVNDIRDYFWEKLKLDLRLFATDAARENLRYRVLFKETDEEKYGELRNLIESHRCPTIVYVSRTRAAVELAGRLTADGFPALPFHGKMEPADKRDNQAAFIEDRVRVIVATSAFGMGVDKSNVGLVVHYDISGSLEDYVQEAGRAGRDPGMEAECCVLFNNADLDRHFQLLNGTKLSIGEIQQVWKAVKDMTRHRPSVCCSALDLARQAGWTNDQDAETRVKTAVAALEKAQYLKRGRNMPRVYATSLVPRSFEEARALIDASDLFSGEEKEHARRIVQKLIAERYRSIAGSADAESRIDYLADMLGLETAQVIRAVDLMRQAGILRNESDMTARIVTAEDTRRRSGMVMKRFTELEKFLIEELGREKPGRRPSADGPVEVNLKELNQLAEESGVPRPSVKNLLTIFLFLFTRSQIRDLERRGSGSVIRFRMEKTIEELRRLSERRMELCGFILDRLYMLAEGREPSARGEVSVPFSVVGLLREYQEEVISEKRVTQHDIEEALLYLSKIGAMRLEGGFLVLYLRMEITRLVTDNRIRYKIEDYRFLDEHYQQKIQQIHIVGEYARLMVRDYDAALGFVQDYFHLDYRAFLRKYFRGDQADEINRNITPQKYAELFGALSPLQKQIIDDSTSKCIVVAAGPGSGKTRVLVHKLAALLLMEDVKSEQLLMLTFSRAAATEFRKRLNALIGAAAGYVDIKTFHSYAFDLIGHVGSLDAADKVIPLATERIRNDEVEPGRIAKRCIVIDEAQDMDANEFAFLRALIEKNEDARVIAVGDDDQNIYAFRGSNSKYLNSMVLEMGAKKYEMTANYRSKGSVVALANQFVSSIRNRMKEEPIHAVRSDMGRVVITLHPRGSNMAAALVEELLETPDAYSTCVLTQLNDEAEEVLSLLLDRNVPARLIQSLDGFHLPDLAEIRHFLRLLESAGPVISGNFWEKAVDRLETIYAASPCMEILRNLIREFRETHDELYRSDLEGFINESNYEDFYSIGRGMVEVSTIHKAKGREFGTVHLLLSGVSDLTDEDRRKIYVGMTRAKNALYIHTDTAFLPAADGVEFVEDRAEYPEPTERVLQLTHRDVWLDFFKGRKQTILKLMSGGRLDFSADDGGLTAMIDGRRLTVVRFSEKFRKSLAKLAARGYKPVSAKVRFIVAWRPKDAAPDEPEHAALLPEVRVRKIRRDGTGE